MIMRSNDFNRDVIICNETGLAQTPVAGGATRVLRTSLLHVIFAQLVRAPWTRKSVVEIIYLVTEDTGVRVLTGVLLAQKPCRLHSASIGTEGQCHPETQTSEFWVAVALCSIVQLQQGNHDLCVCVGV